jgi:hypothetical protein
VDSFRAAIRVRPGSGRDRVGGRAGDPTRPEDLPVLAVQVRARAVAGAATAAAERAVAAALGVRPRQVRVVRGATSRDKIVEVVDPPPDIAARWASLVSGSQAPR